MIELTQAGPDITCEYMFFFSSALTYKALMIPHRQPSPSRRVDMHGGSSGNHSGMHVSYPTSFQPQALVSNSLLRPGTWKGIDQLVRRGFLFFRPNPL